MSKFFRLLFVVLMIFSVRTAFSQIDENSFFDESGEVSTEIASNLPTGGPKDGLEPIEMNNPRADDIYWQKVIYRAIDLREKMNYPLYYPLVPQDNRQSFFTLMFRLIQEGKINAYEYLDGREVFTDDHIVPFSEIVDKFNFTYSIKADSITNDSIIVIDDTDVPTADVFVFYVKEVWFFDKITSTFNVRIISFCPIMSKADDNGIMQKYPLFWVPYESLRPFLSQTEVLITDRNNGARPSFDDIFIKRRFSSYIFKESNIYNRPLVLYNNTCEDVKREQQNIKNCLLNFENDLWEY